MNKNKPFIYKKTIVFTNKFYIGKHKGNKKSYKGSGTDYLKDYELYVKNRKTDLIEEILEYVEDISKLNDRETYWLKLYDAKNNIYCYNRSNISQGCSEMTEISKNLMSLVSPHRKKILQYDLEGNFIKKWDCFSDAARYYNIGVGDLTCCCQGKQKSVNGFQWKYFRKNYSLKIKPYKKFDKNNKEYRENLSNKLKGVPKPKGFGKHRYRAITQYDENMWIVKKWKSVREACLELKKYSTYSNHLISRLESNINGCLKGKQKSAYNYFWKYSK